ncbi:hypothetical protein [Chitinilyticum litopenaei]|uniref:hypothetical protein n=1 Tax=Chitinilyticum litopenaei TaxID=1121276 RepID=UPI0011864665|nr:hypothetical protein [Chitinilyticum litopenaei]
MGNYTISKTGLFGTTPFQTKTAPKWCSFGAPSSSPLKPAPALALRPTSRKNRKTNGVVFWANGVDFRGNGAACFVYIQ